VQTDRPIAPADFAQLIAVAVIWGMNNVAAKIAVSHFPPLMAASMRFAIVLVALFPFLKLPTRESLKPFLLMLVLVGPLHFGIQNVGLALAKDLAPMVIGMQLWVPASVLAAAILLREPLRPLRTIGVALGFVGVASMAFDPVIFAQVEALTLISLAACCYGVGAVMVRQIVGLDAWALQAWLALLITPSLALASLGMESGQVEAVQTADWLVWGCVLFGGVVSSIVANALMFRLVQRYEVSRTTPYMLLSPLVGIGLGILILNDHLTTQIVIGGALALGGVAIVALAEGRLRVLR
jgi:O-acetylserine/cysteine efflux transporter